MMRSAQQLDQNMHIQHHCQPLSDSSLVSHDVDLLVLPLGDLLTAWIHSLAFENLKKAAELIQLNCGQTSCSDSQPTAPSCVIHVYTRALKPAARIFTCFQLFAQSSSRERYAINCFYGVLTKLFIRALSAASNNGGAKRSRETRMYS
jgi:hypothetical protein